MASTESLNAIFRAEDRASGPIEDIADEAEQAAVALDLMDMAGDAAERMLSSLARTATQAIAPLDATAASTAAVGTNASLATSQVEGLDDALSDLDTSSLARVAAQDLGDTERTVAVRTDLDESSAGATRTLLNTLTRDRTVDIRPGVDTSTFALPAIGAIAPTVSPETEDTTARVRAALDDASLASVSSALSTLPDTHDIDVRAAIDEASFGSVRATIAGLGGQQSIDVSSPDAVDTPAMPDLSALDISDETVAVDVEGTDELAAGAAAAHTYAEGLDNVAPSAAQASAMSALLDQEADAAGDSMTAGAAEGNVFSSALGSVRTAAIGAVPGLARYEDQAEEAGDTSSRTAAQIGAMNAAMAGSIGPADGLGGSLFGLHGSLSSLAVILPGVIGLLGGLVGPLGTVAAAAGGAGGALAGLFGAGMLTQAEGLVGTVQEIDGELKTVEGTGEALTVLFGDIKDRAAEILAPLQTAETGQFFQGFVESGLATFESFVEMTQSLMGDLFDMSDRIGDVFAAQRPEFFAELEATTRATLPGIESFITNGLRAIPDALRWIREEGLPTARVLADLGGSALSSAVELAEIGGVVWRTVGPALTFLLDVATGVMDAFTNLPGPLQTFIVASAVAYPILGALASGIAAVSAAGGVLAVVMGAVSWPILAVALAIGAVVAIMSEWDTIINILGESWNWLVGVVEGAVNGVLSWIEGMVNTGIGYVNDLIGAINKIPGIDLEKIGTVDMGTADLSGMEVATASTSGGNGEGRDGGGPSPPGSQPAASTGAGGGATAGGTAGVSTTDSPPSPTINIYATEEQIENPAKLRRLARQAVDEYNKERGKAAGG